MTTVAGLLTDGYGRVREVVHKVLDGLPGDALVFQPDDRANTIAWLVWHLARVQDDHVAAVAGWQQVWTAEGWAERLGLPFAHDATGYGQGPAEVVAVRVGADLLDGYYEAVHRRTLGFLEGLVDADLDHVVDERWDPPVTLGVRLVSVLADGLQHAGQAAYVRGLAERR